MRALKQLFVCLPLVITVLSGCGERPVGDKSSSVKQVELSEQDQKKADCQNELATRRAEYDQLMKEKQFWDASLKLRPCADILADASLQALVDDAEIKEQISVLENPKATASQKFDAAQKLRFGYPEAGTKYENQLAKIEKDYEKHQNKEIAAENKKTADAKRKQGVQIGMTQEDVLASNWGKPLKVNRTVNAYGTREQWVYRGGNYLYFEDGRLTTVQN